MNWPLAFLASGVVLGILDFAWLRTMAPRLYRPELGSIMRPQPDLVAAALFYGLYLVGVVVLAVAPSDSVGAAALRGAVVGLVAYGTYDLTNRATIQPFPWRIVAIDVVWGTALTTAVATAGALAGG